ncbi:MAG TPA: phosphodiester glycosidase family protein [Gemmatimonadales bacterium]|nr:phosphodiester glycosidase family protein [Gemmatimonadales bacterium]
MRSIVRTATTSMVACCVALGTGPAVGAQTVGGSSSETAITRATHGESAALQSDSLLLPRSAFAVFDSLTATRLAPGVVHLSGTIASGPFRVNVIAADLSLPTLGLEAVRAGSGLFGRERTSVLASDWEERSRADGDNVTVLAAVNADFFNLTTGEQLASQVSTGRILKARDGATNDPRADVLVARSGRPHILDATYAGVLLSDGHGMSLDAVNALPDRDSWLALFSPAFGRPVPVDSLSAHVFALREAGARGDTILLVRDSAQRTLAASDSAQRTLLATGAARVRLARLRASEDTIRLVHRFAPVGEGVKTLVGGRPAIVAEGASLHDASGVFSGAPSAFATMRHPRTAVGIGRSGTLLLLVTVDGRQETSVGMSLQELAELMLELGAVDALNLDGGGSTTAVVRGEIASSPSDASGERTVANALLLVLRAR